jgi:hypothetical protein
MTGYLGRLISHTTSQVDESRLQPALRSQSPIAEMDQRIGLAGFEGLTPGSGPVPFEFDAAMPEENAITATSDTTTAPTMLQRKASSSTTAAASTGVPPTRPSARNAPGMAQQNVSEPAAPVIATGGWRTAHSLPATSVETTMTVQSPVPIAPHISASLTDQVSTGMPSVTRHDLAFNKAETPSRALPGDHTRGRNTVDTDVNGDPIIAGVGDVEQRVDTALRDHHTLDKPSLSPLQPLARQLEKIISPTEDAFPQAHPATGTDQPAVAQRALPAHFATPVMLTPPTRSLVSGQAEAAPACSPVAAPETAPRVVIGRINVEVIQPPPERRVTQGSPSQPVTAASVSKIGPLRPALRSNRLLSLRQR